MNKKNTLSNYYSSLGAIISTGLLLLAGSCKSNHLLAVKKKPKDTQTQQNRVQQEASKKVGDSPKDHPMPSNSSLSETQKQPQSVQKNILEITNPQQNELKDIPAATNPQKKLQEYYKDAPLLHWAVAHNHVKLVEWLVTLPVIVIDIYAKDKDGLTPYDLAKKNNNIELVNFFEHYTSPYNKDARCDWPPLYWAIAGNDLEIVKCLVEYPKININEIHADNGSPLHFALSMNDTIEIAIFLVKHPGIDLIQVQLSTWPPLIYLAAKNGHAEVVEFLIKRKNIDHIDLNVHFADDIQWTLLHWAAARGYIGKSHIEIVKTLTTSNLDININARDNEGHTPLHLAARNGCIDVVKILMNLPSVDLNAKDEKGNTPYNIAQQRGHGNVAEIIRLMVSSLQ